MLLQEHKQQVWAQIEAEMHLQRSKTIANMCYSKQRLRDHQITNTVSQQQRKDSSDSQRNGHVKNEFEADVQVGGKLTRNRMKQVHLHKHDADELGMAILGKLIVLWYCRVQKEIAFEIPSRVVSTKRVIQ